MSHSPLFGRLQRALRIGLFAESRGMSTTEALDRAAAAERERAATRREFLAGVAGIAAAGAATVALGPIEAFAAPGGKGTPDVGIVGAGLAGLMCARQLRTAGIVATIYEATANRAGGRQWSDPTTFGAVGQTCELGGELIDTGHHTMRSLATEFKLQLETMPAGPDGDVAYYFNGALRRESDIVDQFRTWVANMKGDLQLLTAAPTADAHNDYDVATDNMSLADYLRRPGKEVPPLLYEVIEQAYIAEYGLQIEQQSPLNFVIFMRANNRAKFQPFGVSNEKYHVVGGNDQIAKRLAAEANAAKPIKYNSMLTKIRQLSSGKVELTFGGSNSFTHDAAIIAIPFTTLRNCDLRAAGLGGGALPTWKADAIQKLGYGNNAKQMVQFSNRAWKSPQTGLEKGGTGAAYADLGECQTTWQTNSVNAADDHAIITDYSGGFRGATLDQKSLQSAVAAFAGDFAKVYPGATPATRQDGSIIAVRQLWPSYSLTKGSYTCYMPGQFTTIAGNEGKPVGNLHFAGEHCDSFYSWQGYMEGALLSGITSAAEILADVKAGNL